MARGKRTASKKQDLWVEICHQLSIPVDPGWVSDKGSNVPADAFLAALSRIGKDTGIPPDSFQPHEKLSWRLIHKSTEGMVLALEVINKPTVDYRLECFLFLLLNSWELLLKAKVVSELKSENAIADPDSPDRTRTFAWAVKTVFASENDPVRKNLLRIEDLRNEAAHFFISLIPPNALQVFQACVMNYERCLLDWFSRSLHERIPFGMMFLVADIDPSQFYEDSPLINKRMTPATLAFLSSWQGRVREDIANLPEGELSHFILPINFKLSIVNNPKKAQILAELAKTENTTSANVVCLAERRVNELDYYSLGAQDVAKKVNLSISKTLAFVQYLKLKADPNCYKEFMVGKTMLKRYSQEAVNRIRSAMEKVRVEDVWSNYHPKKSVTGRQTMADSSSFGGDVQNGKPGGIR